MYWTNGRKIQRANLNGSYIEPLMITGHSFRHSGPRTARPALDVTGGKMYWTGQQRVCRLRRQNSACELGWV